MRPMHNETNAMVPVFAWCLPNLLDQLSVIFAFPFVAEKSWADLSWNLLGGTQTQWMKKSAKEVASTPNNAQVQMGGIFGLVFSCFLCFGFFLFFVFFFLPPTQFGRSMIVACIKRLFWHRNGKTR